MNSTDSDGTPGSKAPFKVSIGSTAKLGTVVGDLFVGRNARIEPLIGTKVVVLGTSHFEGPVVIGCGFECDSMVVAGRGFGPNGDVGVRGNLTVNGNADVSSGLTVLGEVRAKSLDVAGHVTARSVVAERVRVGGHLKLSGDLEAQRADVGGHAVVAGQVKLVEIYAGGHATVGGGSISGVIKTRGHFKTLGKISYGNLNSFGHLRLPEGSSGDALTVSGSVDFEGDAVCKSLKVNGHAKVRGALTAENVEINGGLEVAGLARVKGQLTLNGESTVHDRLECGALSVRGNTSAKSARVEREVLLLGKTETQEGLKATSVVVGVGSRVRGPLIGVEVDIGRDSSLDFGPWGALASVALTRGITEVSEVYAESVTMRQRSHAKSIFADTVKFFEGSRAEEVEYTGVLSVPCDDHPNAHAKKVARLPDPPL